MKKSMNKMVLTLFLSLGIFLTGLAQDPVSSQPVSDQMALDLQSAIDHAITYNKSLQNARLEVERSRKSIWEAIAQGLPQVEGTMDYMSYFNYEMEFNFGGGEAPSFTAQQLQDAYDQTVATFPFYTPADVAMLGANSFYEGQLQSMLPPSAILLSDQSTAKLQFSQLIFSGQYIVGVQTAKLAQQISEQNYEFNELNIKEAVISAYYLVLITGRLSTFSTRM